MLAINLFKKEFKHAYVSIEELLHVNIYCIYCIRLYKHSN